MPKMALFSLDVLDNVEKFARSLTRVGWEIIASKETLGVLSRKNIPALDIADFVGIRQDYGFPPTLHPKIELYLTSSRGPRIDLVYVVPYPWSKGNDVGGTTLLALAAKGNRIPVMLVPDMAKVVGEIGKNGKISEQLHRELINKANFFAANHYGDLITDRKNHDVITGNRLYDLMNGENPYQIPAELFSTKVTDFLSISNFKQISGCPPCFTNLADSDAIITTMCLAAEAFKLKYKKIPYICIVAKHGNACGMAASWNEPSAAIEGALFGNPRASWGGELISNFEIDSNLAKLLFKSDERKEIVGDAAWMLDVVLAPRFTEAAIEILSKRVNRKLLQNDSLRSPFLSMSRYAYRFVRGGFIRQPPNKFVLDFRNVKLTGPKLERHLIDSIIIAWAVAWSSNHGGNEICITKDSRLLAVGG